MTRLSVPRPLSVGVLVVGLSWLVLGLAGVQRRLAALGAEEAVPALRSVTQMGATVVGVLVAAGMVVVGIRWLVSYVDLGDGVVVVRTWRRRESLADVKGIVLRADGGAPQLRVVPRSGPVRVVPAWALRVRHPDGEVEPAVEALPQVGAAHGLPVKVRTLTGSRQ